MRVFFSRDPVKISLYTPPQIRFLATPLFRMSFQKLMKNYQ